MLLVEQNELNPTSAGERPRQAAQLEPNAVERAPRHSSRRIELAHAGPRLESVVCTGNHRLLSKTQMIED